MVTLPGGIQIGQPTMVSPGTGRSAVLSMASGSGTAVPSLPLPNGQFQSGSFPMALNPWQSASTSLPGVPTTSYPSMIYRPVIRYTWVPVQVVAPMPTPMVSSISSKRAMPNAPIPSESQAAHTDTELPVMAVPASVALSESDSLSLERSKPLISYPEGDLARALMDVPLSEEGVSPPLKPVLDDLTREPQSAAEEVSQYVGRVAESLMIEALGQNPDYTKSLQHSAIVRLMEQQSPEEFLIMVQQNPYDMVSFIQENNPELLAPLKNWVNESGILKRFIGSGMLSRFFIGSFPIQFQDDVQQLVQLFKVATEGSVSNASSPSPIDLNAKSADPELNARVAHYIGLLVKASVDQFLDQNPEALFQIQQSGFGRLMDTVPSEQFLTTLAEDPYQILSDDVVIPIQALVQREPLIKYTLQFLNHGGFIGHSVRNQLLNGFPPQYRDDVATLLQDIQPRRFSRSKKQTHQPTFVPHAPQSLMLEA